TASSKQEKLIKLKLISARAYIARALFSEGTKPVSFHPGTHGRVISNDGFGAIRPGGDQGNRGSAQLFDAANVVFGGLGQTVKARYSACVGLPSRQSFVNRLAFRKHVRPVWNRLQ